MLTVWCLALTEKYEKTGLQLGKDTLEPDKGMETCPLSGYLYTHTQTH